MEDIRPATLPILRHNRTRSYPLPPSVSMRTQMRSIKLSTTPSGRRRSVALYSCVVFHLTLLATTCSLDGVSAEIE